MGDDIFRIYRERFRPGPVAQEPYTCLAVFAVCADTEEEARRLALSRELWFLKLADGHGIPFPSVEEAEAYPYSKAERAFLDKRMGGAVIGAPEQVREGLEDRVRRFGADEIMVVSITYDFEARCLSHKLIAEAWTG